MWRDGDTCDGCAVTNTDMRHLTLVVQPQLHGTHRPRHDCSNRPHLVRAVSDTDVHYLTLVVQPQLKQFNWHNIIVGSNSITSSCYYAPPPVGEAKYYDDRVCLIVCLFICLSASISPKLHV